MPSAKRRQPAKPAPVRGSQDASPTAKGGIAEEGNDPRCVPRPGPLSVRLNGNQRFMSYGVAVGAAGSFLALWLPNLHHRVATGATGMSYLIIGLSLASIMVAATASRRRMLAGFAALLLAAAPWGPEHFLQILVFALALWQMFQVAARAPCGERTGGRQDKDQT